MYAQSFALNKALQVSPHTSKGRAQYLAHYRHRKTEAQGPMDSWCDSQGSNTSNL